MAGAKLKHRDFTLDVIVISPHIIRFPLELGVGIFKTQNIEEIIF
jgi:hypothetical protein